jgi:hypothetical protein
MPNPIKYSTGSETLSLKKGNFYIGTGDVGKGPSDTTGYYQGVDVPSGGYVIYMNKEGAPGGLSYHSATNNSELIAFTNNLAGQSYTTVNQCLVYFAGQSDKVVLNRDYEGIVTDGLVLNLDAGFTPSYPKNGTTWYDVGGSNNGTLTNGPTFNSDNSGSIVFDGVDDVVNTTFNTTNYFTKNSPFTICIWTKVGYKPTGSGNRYALLGSGQWKEGGFSIVNSSLASIVFVVNSIDTSLEYGAGIPPEDYNTNEWMYITGTFSSNYINTYKNGVLYSGPIYSEWTTMNSSMKIGNTSQGGYIPMTGNISNVQIYNRELSADEVLQNYNSLKGRFGL